MEAVRLLVVLRVMRCTMLRTRREVNTTEPRRQRAATRCGGSLPSPLHLAIKRNDFLIMFPPAATWTRTVGLCGLILLLIIKLGFKNKAIINLKNNFIA